MLNDEICKLREKLNESIINHEDYNITYKLSIELDELIAKYYKEGIAKKDKRKSKKWNKERSNKSRIEKFTIKKEWKWPFFFLLPCKS